MSGMGSAMWQMKRGGKLTRGEQLRFVGGLIWQRVRLLLASGKSNAEGLARLNLEAIPVPDSRLALQSEEHCRDCSSIPLYIHCLRSYYWAGLLAQYDGRTYDPERLYVAFMLHDLGLTDGAATGSKEHCFAVQGARMAGDFLRAQGAEDCFSQPIEEAIGLHINAEVSLQLYGAEAHYLQAGTLYDVVGGSRFSHIPADYRAEIVARWPRSHFKNDVMTRLSQEVERRPRGRMALLMRLGAKGLIKGHPLP